MTRQSLAAQTLRILSAVVLDVLDALAHLAAVALLTVAIGMALPLPAAFVISLLTVCTLRGYRIARRIDRARMRGEL